MSRKNNKHLLKYIKKEPYTHLQDIAQSMGIPIYFKKTYLASLIHAKHMGDEEKFEFLVEGLRLMSIASVENQALLYNMQYITDHSLEKSTCKIHVCRHESSICVPCLLEELEYLKRTVSEDQPASQPVAVKKQPNQKGRRRKVTSILPLRSKEEVEQLESQKKEAKLRALYHKLKELHLTLTKHNPGGTCAKDDASVNTSQNN